MSKKKPNKKPPSSEKLVLKYGRMIVCIVAADYIRSGSSDHRRILIKEGKEGYVVDDNKVNTDSFFNIIFTEAGISKDIYSLLGKLVYYLTEIPGSKTVKITINKAIEVAKQITRLIKADEYVSLARKMCLCTTYAAYLNPLFMVLDNEYWPDSYVWGFYDGRVYRTINYGPLERPNVPFILFASIDNMLPNDPEFGTCMQIAHDYLKLKGVFFDDYVDSFRDNIADLCAMARMYSDYAIINKFTFNVVKPDFMQEVLFHSLCYEFENLHPGVTLFYRNLFLEIPKDVFTRRKCIFKDTVFPELRSAFSDIYENGEELRTAQTIQNIHVFERTFQTPDGEQFMIFMEYSAYPHQIKRIIPICVDNIFSTIISFSITDYYALITLLGLYGLIDEFSGEMSSYPEIMDALNDTRAYTADVIGVGVEHKHASGYHQNKEVKVEAFVRRLPKGQKASDQAKELARKYHVNLGSENTIVSPYIRNKHSEE